MATRNRDQTYYKVSFTSDNELYQVCARRVAPSDLYGLVEIGEFIFPETTVLYNPGEERLRREFEGIRRTWIPYHSIVRIDEIAESRATEAKIIPLESATRAPRQGPLKQPD